MHQTVEILIPLAAIAMVFGIVYISVTAENRKKMAMIEAGMNPEKKKRSSASETLKRALLFIFIPIGFILGKEFSFLSGDSSISGLLGAFLFGGIALLIFYFIERNKESKELKS